MLLPCANLEMGKFVLDYGAEVKTVSTWKNLTDTATLVFPRPVKYQDKRLEEVVKRGDDVLIKLGFDTVLSQRFKGYINTVNPNQLVEIGCEDEMWKWKQKPVQPHSWQDASLGDVLKYCGFTDYELLGDSVHIGAWQIDKRVTSAAGVLAKLKDEVHVPSFFRDGKLYVGKPYNNKLSVEHLFAFNHNIISHDLEYKRKDEVRIQVKAISKTVKGKDLTVTIGDDQGETHTLHYFELSETELKRRATEEMELLKYDGWRGKMKVFGEPVIHHGDVIKLIDPDDREKDGKFFVDRVEATNDTTQGYVQDVTIGLKAA